MDVKSVILEELSNFVEGTGDKYAAGFNVPDAGQEFEDSWERKVQTERNTEKDKIVGHVKDPKKGLVPIYKNPSSLDTFGPNVRSISDAHGNLYVAQFDGSFVHGEIAQAVGLKDVNDPKKYVTWSRWGKSTNFMMTSTYGSWYSTLMKDDPEGTQTRIDAVKKKFPFINFMSYR